MRVNNEMLTNVLANIETARKALGIDPELISYNLAAGSASNGIAYRIYGLRAGETGHAHVDVCSGDRGYLGMTKREAYDKLVTINVALSAARRANND